MIQLKELFSALLIAMLTSAISAVVIYRDGDLTETKRLALREIMRVEELYFHAFVSRESLSETTRLLDYRAFDEAVKVFRNRLPEGFTTCLSSEFQRAKLAYYETYINPDESYKNIKTRLEKLQIKIVEWHNDERYFLSIFKSSKQSWCL